MCQSDPLDAAAESGVMPHACMWHIEQLCILPWLQCREHVPGHRTSSSPSIFSRNSEHTKGKFHSQIFHCLWNFRRLAEEAFHEEGVKIQSLLESG